MQGGRKLGGKGGREGRLTDLFCHANVDAADDGDEGMMMKG